MIKNFLKTALRSLYKNKFYSFLNIAGLAIGIACTVIIALFVQNELSFDKFNRNYHNLYRVGADLSIAGQDIKIATMPAPAAETFVNEYPEVINACRFRSTGSSIIQYNEVSFKEQNIIYADSTLFELFSINVLQGDARSALASPNSLAISKSAANKYFGTENPIGKILRFDNDVDYNVTAVFEDIPHNSHIQSDFFPSIVTREEANDKEAWLSFNFQTYVLLADGASPNTVLEKFPGTILKYCEPLLVKYMNSSFEKLEKEGGHAYFFIEPMKDIYLYSDVKDQIGPTGSIDYVYIFSAIAFFVLVIACINFINLTTAHSAGRAKEVGIRKTLGSFRRDLVAQFITESVMLSLIATILAVGLVELSLPYFNSLASKELSTNYFGNSFLTLLLLFLPLIVGMLAGAYPAFVISGFQPVSILRGKIKGGAKSGYLRSSLVVLQFSASIILLVGTITILEQLNFIQNKKLGYNREQLLIINDAYLLGDQVESYKNEILNSSGILSGTVSGYLPVPSSRNNSVVLPNGQPDHPKAAPVQIFRTDYDYIKTLGMKIVEGRDFNRDFATDSSAIIINQAAKKHYGWDNPADHTIGMFVSNQGDVKLFNVIGVVEDFNFATLREPIGPLVIIAERSTGHITFRLKTENVKTLLAEMENKWKEFAPTQPFSYTFMDESFDRIYRDEQRLGEIFGLFAGLAITIGCLGLFGLAAFTAQRRTKEIGIRKVMGASIPGIVTLMGSEFVKLVIISFLIAAPLSYFIMDSWLEDFAYRIDLGLFVFMAAGILSFLIAIITVSYHSIKSALANPVKSIRYE